MPDNLNKGKLEKIYENVKPVLKDTKRTSTPRSWRLWLCLGITFFLLLGSIALNIWTSLQLNKQKANISESTMMMRDFKNPNEELIHENRVLKQLLKAGNFPFSEYCNGKEWQPCRKGWIEFQKKCYLFYNESTTKNLEGSQQYCKDKASDLVTVDNLQEQEFLSNHSTYYYDDHHGYWLGLRKVNNIWQWPDGRHDTLRYWMDQPFGGSGPYVLLIPGRPPTKSWDTSDAAFHNRLICEQEALIIPQTHSTESFENLCGETLQD
ncbi:dromaiocalcin-1-like [Fundulus heteroclitus]|uniref:dromaiocalcin-1-like n=1 Tax=Fundulus heteroclitus TaxID=8078 RepID=UPI00165CA5C0|nr:dromaiocalcin-1-like [Fundulus heteroclitus]